MTNGQAVWLAATGIAALVAAIAVLALMPERQAGWVSFTIFMAAIVAMVEAERNQRIGSRGQLYVYAAVFGLLISDPVVTVMSAAGLIDRDPGRLGGTYLVFIGLMALGYGLRYRRKRDS